jgi:restriction endonuclease S subunit
VQQEIVDNIEGYEKIITGAKQVIENYKPQIDINTDWEMVELRSVCEINPKKSEIENRDDLTVSFVPMADINENSDEFNPKEERNIRDVYNGYTYFRDNDVLLAKVTPCFENGKAGIARNLRSGIGFGSSEFIVFRSNEKVLPMWLYLNVTSPRFRELGKARMTGTGGLQRVPKDFVENYLIPLPPVEVQKVVIAEIERVKELVSNNRQLVQLFQQKITAEINKLWEE